MTVDEAFRILRSLPGDWGASEADVRDFETRHGVRLPAPLRELMLRTGRGMHMHWLFPDEGIAPLDELPFLQEIAGEILAEDAPALHPTFPFVVLWQHDGYQFIFVQAESLDTDPLVMFYEQGHGFGPSVGRLTIGQCIAAAVRRALSRDS